MVRYDFPQPDPERWMAAFDVAIANVRAQAADDHAGRAATMDDALVDVLAVFLLAGRDAGEPWTSQRLPAFRAHVREILPGHTEALAAWLGDLDVALWWRNRNGWYAACMRRSAAEVLIREIDEPADDPLVPAHRLADVDAEMREIGPALNALPREAIPRDLPDAHWWWLLPQGPAEDDIDPADLPL